MKKIITWVSVIILAGISGFFVATRFSGPQLGGEEIVKTFTHYYIDSDKNRIFGAEFLGVPSWQNPCDMWMMQKIIYDVKPDFIIEAGTAYGGSALYFATMLAQVNEDGKVITIDIEPQVDEASKYDLFRERVEVITSNSVSPELLKSLEGRTRNKKVLVTLDSNHSKEHVLKELALYSQLVSLNSYIVVQDTIIDQKQEWIEEYVTKYAPGSRAGPAEAVNVFIESNADFVIDRSRELFLLTFHPSGYLKRVR